MDKILLKFFADVLYVKGLLSSEELEDIYDVRVVEDLDKVFEKMMRGEYHVCRKGESYYRIKRREECGIGSESIGDSDTTDKDAKIHSLIYDGTVHDK